MVDKPDRAKEDVARFWKVLGERPIGFTVVTAAGDEPVGFVGLAVAHVSPPLISVAIDIQNRALEPIRRSGSFAVNFFSAKDEVIAEAFMKKGASGAERFWPHNWETLETGSPVLSTATGVFDCVVERVVELDHVNLIIGRVVASRIRQNGPPLVFFRGALSAMAICRNVQACDALK
ncbi:flavin reductase family protein [Aminobacter aminovorans]|jgi:flavin reductase (DIM6/NTAB) family NADH-FMN oxidoreductase RutF|uniref:Flavin reductase (DIM6/NTAB) family NADH-FMN oxidoreductase RutF n=1 Tax=Aminobacter aminovorans TaxID=83263 RepID=A0AAC8YUY1_AMIAI|nr:flavin reductase family protein [Aminobacter aminovorans]AMS44928.1 Flavin reductase domain protein FMN-binding protein [Aminobacter aminovorans]MBB3704881.1 flavin reductase (DIM6/NTAB) family NADH-FMN oxidoreductase RutF [Aminobacter aminovorans]